MTRAIPWEGFLIAAALGVGLAAGGATSARADDSLTVFEWSGYEADELHPAYIEKYGAAPAFSLYDDEADAFEKIRAGFKADIGHPCSQNVGKWREAGILEPLDTSRIAGWDDLMPSIMAMPDLATTADGTAWFMPWDWGNVLLAYNTETVDPADIHSLKAFADPKFRGRVAMISNSDDAYALAALVLGIKDWTNMTEAQFEEASAFLREVHKNVRMYWSDDTELVQALSSGEVDLAWAWNASVEQSQEAGAPIAAKTDTDEGLATWVCGFVLFKDAPGSRDRAYDFLSAANDPAVAATLLDGWGYAHANARGMAEADPALLAQKGYEDFGKFLDNTLFEGPLPVDIQQRMVAEYEKIKPGY